MCNSDQDKIETAAKAIAKFLSINWDATSPSETSNGCDPEEDREYCRKISKIVIKSMEKW